MTILTHIKKYHILLCLILLAAIYAYFRIVVVGEFIVAKHCKDKSIVSQQATIPFENAFEDNVDSYVFEGNLLSKLKQNVVFNVSLDDELQEVILNGREISLQQLKHINKQKNLTNWDVGYSILLPLRDGNNSLAIKGINYVHKCSFNIRQMMSLTDWVVFFLCLLSPLVILGVDFYIKNSQSGLLSLSKRSIWNYSNYILFGIVVFGLFLRTYKLGIIPYGFHHDEASEGYSAYCLLKTGCDMYGRFLPLYLINHHGQDYYEPLYEYLTVIPVALFGLNVFAARFIAAFTGTCTILTTYLFTRELFNKKIAILSALFICLSPWAVQLSRLSNRACFIPLLSTLGLYFFLKAFKCPKYFIFSAFVFSLAFTTYTIMRLFMPLCILGLIAFYYEKIKRSIAIETISMQKHLTAAIIIASLIVLPLYYYSFWGPLNHRLHGFDIFNGENPMKQYLENFASHLSINYLFICGDSNRRHMIPGMGQVLIILMPFILCGLYFFFRKMNSKGFLLLYLFLAGLLTASVVNEGIPHAIRSFAATPFIEIIGAYGFYVLYKLLKQRNKQISNALLMGSACLFLVNAAYYVDSYFRRYPHIAPGYFLVGMEEAIKYTEANSSKYDNIILSSSISYSYTYPLFFAALDPVAYQKNNNMGKYRTSPYFDFTKGYPQTGHNMLIVFPDEVPNGKVLKYVENHDHQPVLKIVETM